MPIGTRLGLRSTVQSLKPLKIREAAFAKFLFFEAALTNSSFEAALTKLCLGAAVGPNTFVGPTQL